MLLAAAFFFAGVNNVPAASVVSPKVLNSMTGNNSGEKKKNCPQLLLVVYLQNECFVDVASCFPFSSVRSLFSLSPPHPRRVRPDFVVVAISSYEPGDFILHFAGKKERVRLKLVDYYYPRAKKVRAVLVGVRS